ncbi:Pheromone a factor receptor [Trichoderma lentiforme]|uniref:Pheromone a factor receptor n=1 Tax=Trichoderma lentiforme TaxID=1567552 RepID=A0A9P5CHC8_9HYPO|nr:Pheromone a factor receptor [Trichoderma lentiforme]
MSTTIPLYPITPDFSIFMLGLPPTIYTTPSLTVNLVCRIFFGILANLICLIPLQLLYRNGEFAAVVFILNMELENLRNIVNALIWRNDDVKSWWPGYGLCDVDGHLHNFCISLYATCLLAIMRNLAIQVGSLRANPPSRREKRRRNIIQALIIFPLPLVQVAWTYPLAQQRYYVGTLVGCFWPTASAWPTIVFEILPQAVVSVITAGYAIFIYIRFRQITKSTQSALSSNPLAHVRNQRARRRLYLMVISILIPFLPVILALATINIVNTLPLEPFDFKAIHSNERSVPWNTIMYLPSSQIGWMFTNICYVPIVTAIPVFVFFGMTKDAMNCYRVILLYVGLGKVFPSLYEEYNPDSRALASMSNGCSNSNTASTRSSKKNPTSSGVLSNILSNQTTSSALQQPLPTASLPIHNQDVPIQLPQPNPFLFRTRLNFSLPFSLSLFKVPETKTSSTPLEPLSYQPTHQSGWSDEEAKLFVPSSDSASGQAASDDNSKNENDDLTITALPPVLVLDSTLNRSNSKRKH